jgi:tetratricopeptide (TPR) repeat protein
VIFERGSLPRSAPLRLPGENTPQTNVVTRANLAIFLLSALICLTAPATAQEHTEEVNAAMAQAQQALAHHDLQKAVQEYALILKLDPRNAEIYTADGVALYGLGRQMEASKALQTALSIDPNQSTAEIFLGLSSYNLGECGRAIPLLQKHFVPQTAPNLRRMIGISLLGCYRTTAQFKKAFDLVLKLEQSFPADADVLYNAAELYTQLWNVSASELMKDHPESYRVHQLAGEVLEAQGNYGRATKEYMLALKDNNNIPGLHYRIGKMIVDEGGPGADQRAMAYFQQELEVNPRDSATEYSMGEILQQQRRLSDAVKHYQDALRTDPEFVEAHIGLGQALFQEHELEPAQRELERAIELSPENPTAHYDLMMVYRDLGKTNEALKEMTLFQKLRVKKQQDFRSRLQALLTGKGSHIHPPR